MITDLIPSINRDSNPLPIPTFLGSTPVDRSSALGTSKDSQGKGPHIVSDPAWSRGLGFEVSPIKTRSARRKAGSTNTTSNSLPNTSTDLGALRGMKALERDKS
jgi:hypothetical protein